jgi:hypothetical protein
VDRQRNDRLGRKRLPPKPLLKHRGKILCAIRGYTNADTYSYGHGNSDCDCNSYADHHTHRYTKSKSDAQE